MRHVKYILCLAALAFLLGCTEFGKVDQGRVVAFDSKENKVTFVRDKTAKPGATDYSMLPPVVFELPKDPVETGPTPKAGLRMKLDTQRSQITLFDPKDQTFKVIAFKIHNLQENVDKDHPLVFYKDAGKACTFPQVDKAKKTITIYSGRTKTLVTFSVPDEYFSLPDYAWDAGDEVRVYYKENGQALRFMNVTKTDIFKK